MGEPNWADKTVWTGDNLPSMRAMNSESVDLIYLDPPFNQVQGVIRPLPHPVEAVSVVERVGVQFGREKTFRQPAMPM